MDKKVITVTTESAFKNAVDAEYDIIIIAGEYSHEISRKLKGGKKVNGASNIAILVGLFWTPLLVAGIAGKVFSRKLKKYKITEIDNEFVTVKRKAK